jgi:protein-tyrosine phosphatase
MTSILVICTGNICRSPISEGLLRNALERRFGPAAPDVSSAGTSGLEGSGAMPESVQAASELGIDIAGHIARRLTPGMASDADLLLCMARDHRDTFAPPLDARAFTLKELVRLLQTLPVPPADAVPEIIAERISAADHARRSGAVAPSYDEDIADPLGQPLEAYRAIAWEIETWSDQLVDALYGAVADDDLAEVT